MGLSVTAIIIVLLIMLGIHVTLIILGAKIGIKKGYSGAVGGLLVAFLGLIGLLIIAVMGPANPYPMPPINYTPNNDSSRTKQTTEEKLKKIDKLLDEEHITKEEYEILRKRILDEAAE